MRFLRKVPKLTVILALVLSMTTGAEVHAPSPAVAKPSQLPAVGVNFHGMWNDYTDSDRSAVLDKLATAGVRWVRIDIGWSWFEYAGKGRVDQAMLARANKLVDSARHRGINVLLMVSNTPQWANGGLAENVPPTDPADYADFMRYIAGQFAGRVAAWQIWNEPNIDVFWSTTDPAQYAGLVRAAYPAIKSADPNAKVVIGGVSLNDDPWLSRMYDAGVTGSYDVLAAHPYQNPSDRGPEFPDDGNIWTLDHIRAVRALMVARGEVAKGLWATEFGWSSDVVSEEVQADFLKRSLRFFAEQHPYVSNVFWYNARAKATGNLVEDGYGLLRRDLTEKPAYKALKTTLRSAR
ncbi:MAG TPA: cellulase family glycosylhydrolase [Acidimicrobiales bacterium]|nr:cellulase family glycosylhydrolase [Acidimicrobiales bacterium]